MKSAGLSFSFKNILTVLPNVFKNVSNAFTGMAIAFDSGGAKISKLRRVLMATKTGFSGFFEVLKANKVTVFLVAVVALMTALSKLTNAAKESKEALHEQYVSDADKAAEQLSDTKEANTQLSEIIEKYKAIDASNLSGLEKRAQLRSLQEELNKLLGAEASTIDVVNGKLSTQLSTLKNINLEQAGRQYSDAIAAAKGYSLSSETDTYHNAPNIPVLSDLPFLSLLKGSNDWFSGDKDYTFRVDDKDIEKIDDIKNSLNKVGVYFRNFTDGTVRTEDPWVKISLDPDMPMAEAKEALYAALAQLQSDGLGETTTAKEISRIYTQLFGKGSNFEKSALYYKDALNTAIILSKDVQAAEDKSVNSYEEYLKLRDDLVKRIKEDNPEIKDALDNGWLSDTDIYKAVDERLQVFSSLGNFYVGDDIVKTIQKIEAIFSKKAFDNTGKKAYTEAKEWFDNLSPNDKALIFQIGLDTTTAKWELEDWKKALEEAKKDTETKVLGFEETIQKIFSSKDDNDKTFSDRIKTYRDNMSTLNEALEKLRNGELDSDSYHNLIETFPQLVGRTNDLDDAIVELMDDMDSNITADFDEQFGKLDTQEDIDALENYKAQLLKLRESNIKFKSSIDDVVSAFSTVKSVIDDYNESGYLTLDNLQSILALDDKYIAALTNEQGALDLSTKSYKNLVKAELTELKAQMLQESIDSVSNFQNQAQALAYLENTKTDAAAASLNLADAQWQEALAAASLRDIQEGTGDLYQRTVIRAREVYESKIALINAYEESAFTVGELSNATDEYSESLNNEKDALESAKEALEDQKDALEDMKSGYEDAMSSIKDLIDWVEDYIKQIKNDEIDALQEKKDVIDELIEAQKDLLDAEKDEYEWNKKISEKQNTVAKDALAASIASLDDSSAGRKAQKQANDKLAESRSDMLDTLYDHEIEIRKDALDKLKEEQDEYYDNLINNIQDYLNNEVQLYKDACAMIDNDSGDLYGKLLWYCQNYTTTTEAEFNHMWNSAQSALQQYNIANLGTFDLLNNLQGRIYEVDEAIDTISRSIASYETAIDGVQNKLDDLSKSAQKTISDIKAAAYTWNNVPDNNFDSTTYTKEEYVGRGYDAAKGKYYYRVHYHGREYTGYVGDSSDTEAVRRIAALDITKQIAKYHSGFDQYGLSIIQGLLNKKSKLKRYASGTNSAVGGLSLVGERGAELRVLNSGDGILNHQITQGLAALGANPGQFIADAGKKLLSSLFGNSIKPSFEGIGLGSRNIDSDINIVIQGDATQSTVNALRAAADDIVNRATRNIMNQTLRNKRVI